MKTIAALVSLATCIACTPIARATTMDGYLRATGVVQGVFKGAGMSTVNNIPFISLTTSIHAGDESSSLNTVTIALAVADAKEFVKAGTSKEAISKIEVVELRPGTTQGTVQKYFYIDLSQATVIRFTQQAGPVGGPALVEVITLTFGDLHMSYPATPAITSQNDWQSRV